MTVPHDDEITWDAHDRIPDAEGLANMPSRGYCILYAGILLLVTGVILGGLYLQ
jgi:hypothetical protein